MYLAGTLCCLPACRHLGHSQPPSQPTPLPACLPAPRPQPAPFPSHSAGCLPAGNSATASPPSQPLPPGPEASVNLAITIETHTRSPPRRPRRGARRRGTISCPALSRLKSSSQRCLVSSHRVSAVSSRVIEREVQLPPRPRRGARRRGCTGRASRPGPRPSTAAGTPRPPQTPSAAPPRPRPRPQERVGRGRGRRGGDGGRREGRPPPPICVRVEV